MLTPLQDFLTFLISIVVEALPFVVLGIIISVAVQVWLPEGWLLRRLPKRRWVRQVTISLLGVFVPVCECGNVPLARGLLVQGLSASESLVFLLAAPVLNPVTIITTQQAFANDPVVLAGRMAGGFVIANVVGWVFMRRRRDELLQPDFIKTCQISRHIHERRWARSLELFRHEASHILPALLFGAAAAALVQVAVPREILLTLGSNPAWSIAAMLVLAFVISICSNVDAFFALAFRDTFTAGSLVSFLVFGPMIDIKLLSLMRTTYQPKVLMQVSLSVLLMAAAIGLGVNYVL
ncbi:permease [TM7 phylum sp. oral taxon 349]|jgi:hypothetical protein|nr:permease [TM7 phylum sp. oral taxon 349]RKV93612.1 MAG: permease [Candidatus Saccharimonas sp.]